MSGHSKWSTIKRKKEAKDAKRGKLFTKLLKEITVSAKIGGSDPETNSRLRLAIQNAKSGNLPKDNITRAIKKAESKDTADFQEVTYEGYGPNGVGIFVECQTDNLNRTVASVRNIFNRNGGSLGKKGSLEFMFEQKGVFNFTKPPDLDQEELELEFIESGAEDIEINDDDFLIIVAVDDFYTMQTKLESLKLEIESAGLERFPISKIKLEENEQAKIFRIIEKLEEDDDVQKVYHNLDL